MLQSSNRVQIDSSATQQDNLLCNELQIRVLGTCELRTIAVKPHAHVPLDESWKAEWIIGKTRLTKRAPHSPVASGYISHAKYR